MWFSPSPVENWTERHGGCGTKAQQNTLSSSSPPSEPVRFAKSSRWRWLKHTQCSVLLHLGPLSRNFALCYLCQVFSQKYHPQTTCCCLLWSRYRNAVGPCAWLRAPEAVPSLASVSCPFLLLPLVSSEESAQMLPGILALAEHLHAARLCTKHPCNTTSGAQSRRKDLSEVITNQAEKYQQKTGNTQQKLCLLRAAHALPTTRFNC